MSSKKQTDTKGRKKSKCSLFNISTYPKWIKYLGQILLVILYVWGFYYLFVSSFNFRWKAIYGSENYPDVSEIHGIDISHHQGDIEWKKLAGAKINNNPLTFVIIKATQGVGFIDENFNDNFHNALEYGFIRGAYHYWSNQTRPEDQAAFYIKNVRLEKGDLAPVLDVEDYPGDTDIKTFQRNVLKWLDIIEKKYGVTPIIYTGYKFKLDYLSSPKFDRYPFWMAHYYVQEVKYKGDWKFWQHTDAGKLPGIKGYVDFDIYNGSFYDLTRLTIGHEK